MKFPEIVTSSRVPRTEVHFVKVDPLRGPEIVGKIVNLAEPSNPTLEAAAALWTGRDR